MRIMRALGRRLSRLAWLPRDAGRWRTIARTAPARGEIAVSYGHPLPSLEAPGRGGTVKFQQLARAFPEANGRFNILYLGSSDRPDDLRMLIRLARRRGAAFVWNQNGVAYPGWAGAKTAAINRPLAFALHAADHVVYQSEFCRASSDRFLGARTGPWEILHNPVDTKAFVPVLRAKRALTLLLGGNQYQRYRVETALRTLAALNGDARLLVTGELSYSHDAERELLAFAQALGVADRVELVGPYARRDAPAVFARADVLLHTKVNDPCPATVLEAMACGLPVVYSASGGVPELVGDSGAGIGVPAVLDYERDVPPDPRSLAQAVQHVAENLDERAAAARERSLRFELDGWIQRHRELFETLIR